MLQHLTQRTLTPQESSSSRVWVIFSSLIDQVHDTLACFVVLHDDDERELLSEHQVHEVHHNHGYHFVLQSQFHKLHELVSELDDVSEMEKNVQLSFDFVQQLVFLVPKI